MKVFKRLSRWWREEYGGEWVAHADFVMEPGDTFASAFAALFEGIKDVFWTEPIADGYFQKVHVKFSFQSDMQEFWEREYGGPEQRQDAKS